MPRAQLLAIDEARPNPRKIQQVIDCLERGGIIAYPTDTVYGMACDVNNRKGADRLRRMKGLRADHRLSFVFADLSTIAHYAHVSDVTYRWLRKLLPGPYTVVLNATRALPKILGKKRREIGVRIPQNTICTDLVQALGRPLVSTSASTAIDADIPGQATVEDLLIDPDIIKKELGTHLDLIVDGGLLTREPSTVVSFVSGSIEIIREGKGRTDIF